MGSKILPNKRRYTKHLIRMIRKDQDFSSRISPYFPSNIHHDSPFRTNDLSIQRWSDNSIIPMHSTHGAFYEKEDLQNYLTRKWMKLLGLSMYFKNQ